MDCIFCRIAAGEIPATVVARSSGAMAFRDLAPQAPTHVLVIPTHHVGSVTDLAPGDREPVVGHVVALAIQVATDLGLDRGGYRLVVNAGKDGGQSVGHLHVHLLGGRQMRWPPG